MIDYALQGLYEEEAGPAARVLGESDVDAIAAAAAESRVESPDQVITRLLGSAGIGVYYGGGNARYVRAYGRCARRFIDRWKSGRRKFTESDLQTVEGLWSCYDSGLSQERIARSAHLGTAKVQSYFRELGFVFQRRLPNQRGEVVRGPCIECGAGPFDVSELDERRRCPDCSPTTPNIQEER